MSKTAPTDIETGLLRRGYQYIIGIDEAGRGALAGPIYVGYAVLPLIPTSETQHRNATQLFLDKGLNALRPAQKHALVMNGVMSLSTMFDGVRDSKMFRDSSKETAHQKRTQILNRIKWRLMTGGTAFASAKHIDEVGVDMACEGLVQECVAHAVDNIRKWLEGETNYPAPDYNNVYLLCDSGLLRRQGVSGYSGENVIQGDAKSLSIAAASLFAKVERDNYMLALDAAHPQYGFDTHKGYYGHGTAHMSVIKDIGIINEYRRSYEPICSWLKDGTISFRN